MDAAFVRDVIAHMNANHADAVLNIARFYGEDGSITSAVMVDLSAETLTLSAQSAAGHEPLTLTLPKHIAAPAEVRILLIRMSRVARMGLAAQKQART